VLRVDAGRYVCRLVGGSRVVRRFCGRQIEYVVRRPGEAERLFDPDVPASRDPGRAGCRAVSRGPSLELPGELVDEIAPRVAEQLGPQNMMESAR
jgi:hypothetical protein